MHLTMSFIVKICFKEWKQVILNHYKKFFNIIINIKYYNVYYYIIIIIIIINIININIMINTIINITFIINNKIINITFNINNNNSYMITKFI